MKILIVDDKEENLYLLEILMKAKGYEVVSAANGADALEKLSVEAPDMIVSDILMPIMDGFQFCSKVKGDNDLKNIPFVFYTAAYTDENDEEFALKLGADRFIRKPMDPDDFMENIEALILQAQEGKIAWREPDLKDEKEGFNLYSGRLVTKLEKKMEELESEIAERKLTEKALRDSEEKYRSLVDNIGLGVSLISPDMEVLTLNSQMKKWFPLVDETRKPICYRSFYDPPREDICPSCPTLKTLRDGQHRETTTETLRGGHDGVFRIISSPIKDENNNIKNAIEIIEDITERKQAEEALKDAYDIISKSPAVAFLWKNDEGWPVEFVSPNVESIFGYTADEFVSRNVDYTMTVHPDDRNRVLENLSRYSSEEASESLVHKPYRIVTKEGEVKWVDGKTYIRRDDEGNITHYQGIVEDVTNRIMVQEEKENLEKQLQQAQKMEALGTLAGGIAHDFNNILGGIIGYTELAKDGLSEDLPAFEDLNKVLSASSRAKDLVDHILAFSRQSMAELKPLRISLIIKEALRLLRASLPTTVEIRQNLESKMEIVNADPTQIHQVLMNLCTNAAHAMRQTGGILEVNLHPVEIDKTMAASYPEISPGNYLGLAISDTGHGMSPDVLERIFDPYYTTKEKGEGTGLGLAVVHGIVKSHGGTINVDSTPGKGTTFNVYLPMANKMNEIMTSESLASELPTGNEQLLMVDDEQDLVNIGKRLLESLGYKVIALTSSIEALDLFRELPDKIDLVITDQTMPNMTGLDLAFELKKIRSDIPIVLCTGFSELITEEKKKEAGICGFVKKPISKKEISMTIREVLDG